MKTNANFMFGSLLIMLLLVTSNVSRSQSPSENGGDTKKDTMVRNLQVSFLPFMNINSPSTTNRVNVSINILAGYVQEVRVFEAGSILNVVRNDAGTCQLAGVGNIVLGSSRGLQAAGTFNVAKNVKGVQAAGVLNAVLNNVSSCQLAGVGNIVGDTTTGLQAAGVVNATKTMKGVQVAGVLNTALTANGCQLAGVSNLVGDSTKGWQGAGVLNASKSMKGLQAAGVLNAVLKDAQKCQLAGVGNVVGGSFHGLQAAGVFNYATKADGVQMSGVLNVAWFFKGVQLSVVNLADSCDGLPIGVFSFVVNGYHKLELSMDELLFANIAFRTGVKHFYNILMAGIRPDNFDTPLWSYGYGAGTTFGRSDKLAIDIDLSAQEILKGNSFDFKNELYKLYVGVDFKLTSKTSIAAGLSYNVLRSDTDSPQYSETFSKLAPYSFSNKTYHSGNNYKNWVGAKIAIRFL